MLTVLTQTPLSAPGVEGAFARAAADTIGWSAATTSSVTG